MCDKTPANLSHGEVCCRRRERQPRRGANNDVVECHFLCLDLAQVIPADYRDVRFFFLLYVLKRLFRFALVQQITHASGRGSPHTEPFDIRTAGGEGGSAGGGATQYTFKFRSKIVPEEIIVMMCRWPAGVVFSETCQRCE